MTLRCLLHRACIGRSLAKMQLQINIATVFRLYDVVLETPDMPVRLKSDLCTERPYQLDIFPATLT